MLSNLDIIGWKENSEDSQRPCQMMMIYKLNKYVVLLPKLSISLQ